MNTPDGAPELRNAILEVDIWDRGMPDEISYPNHATLASVSDTTVDDLPAQTQQRLQVTPDNRNGNYGIVIGRRWHPKGWGKTGDERFIDYGPDAAFLLITRVCAKRKIRVASSYDLSVAESYEPSQPPLCEVTVNPVDDSAHFTLIDTLNKHGGSLADVVSAMGVDPSRDLDDQATAKPNLSEADFRIALHEQLTGQEMDQQAADDLRAEHEAREGMSDLEAALGMNTATNDELIALAGLVRRTRFLPNI